MKSTYAFIVFLVVALIAACGCTSTNAPPATGTPSGTQAQQTVVSLVTSPTDAMPNNREVSITVDEKDNMGIILVTFDGGMGMNAVTDVNIKLTRADGSVTTSKLLPKKGDTVELSGTRGSGSERGQADRVEAWVTMNTGQTFKVADVLREYRSRG